MLSMFVLHSLATENINQFTIEDKIFALTLVRLILCIVNVLRRSKFRRDQLDRQHLHD